MFSLLPRNSFRTGLKTWGDPWTRYEFNDWLDDLAQVWSNPSAHKNTFKVDVREEGNTIILDADMPGLKKEDIDISIEDDILSITAKKCNQCDKQSSSYYVRERAASEISRKFTLPRGIKPESLNAIYRDGVLTLTIDKSNSVGRKIDIQD